MADIWTPGGFVCRVCGQRFAAHRIELFHRHVGHCVERHGDAIDRYRPVEIFEGDPELNLFARTEGDVYNRRPGTRKQAR